MRVRFWKSDARDVGIARARAGLGIVACLIAALSLGCDSNPFTPPEPDELKLDVAAPAVVAPAPEGSVAASPDSKSIELVLDRHDPEESEVFKTAARTQAGRERVRLRLSTLAPSDLSSHQAELVREAMSRRPIALIVEPADPADPRLAQAVAEASVLVPVFLLDRPLVASPSAGAPKPAPGRVTVVAPPPFSESAGRLVASAIRCAKNASLDPTAGAILVINTVSDPFVDDRAAALRDQLKAAGVKQITEIRFAQKVEDAVKQLTERLKTDAKPSMVFAVDSPSMTASREASNQLVDERPFVTAGYTAEEQLGQTARTGDLAAVAEFIPTRIVRKAVSLAAQAAAGNPAPEKVELAIVFHDSPPDAGLPRTQSFYKSRGNQLPTPSRSKR